MLDLVVSFAADYWAHEVDTPSAGPDVEVGTEYGAFMTSIGVTTPEDSYVLGLHSPKPGLRVVSGLFTTPDPWRLCAVVRGTVVLGDVRTPASFHEVRQARGNVMEVRAALDAGILLLVTEGEVLALDSLGLRWYTPRIAADGIRIDKCGADTIRGTADHEWNPAPFTIDVASGRVEGGNPTA